MYPTFIVSGTRVRKFSKNLSHPKTLVSRRVTCSKFHRY